MNERVNTIKYIQYDFKISMNYNKKYLQLHLQVGKLSVSKRFQ